MKRLSALDITVTSYLGQMFFGFHACRESVGDVWGIARAADESLDELTKAASAA